MTGHPTTALVLDVDGVLSPLHGHTAFGDDRIAGDLFGPVQISPRLVRHLQRLAARPEVVCAWLTDWPATFRAHMRGFPGEDWPDIGHVYRTQARRDHPETWWKPVALRQWLDDHRSLTRVLWCDDDLAHASNDANDLDDADLVPLLGEAAPARGALLGPGSTHLEVDLVDRTLLLIAPRADTGLTPRDLDRIDRFLTQHPAGDA